MSQYDPSLFVFNFMLKHFELVKCPLCSSFCCVLLIFLYGIKGCFLSKIYGLNILLNQHRHPAQLRHTTLEAGDSGDISK